MSKFPSGLLLAGVVLAITTFAGTTMAGDPTGSDAFVSWGTVAETDLAAQRGLGAEFNFDDINVLVDSTVVDNSTSVDDAIMDNFQANGAVVGGDGAAVGAENAGSVASDHSISVTSTNGANAIDGGMATDEGAIVGRDGTAIGDDNSGAVATGEGTTAINKPKDSFNTSNDENQFGYADSDQDIDIDVGGNVGDSGVIRNIYVGDGSGIGINTFNTGFGNNFASSLVVNVNLN